MSVVASDVRRFEKECGRLLRAPDLSPLWLNKCAEGLQENGYSVADRYTGRGGAFDYWGRALIFGDNGNFRYLLSLGADGKSGGLKEDRDLQKKID